MKMRTVNLITLIYGLLVFAGGLMGYAQAHSLMSLIMGSSSGVILIVCSTLQAKKPFTYLINYALVWMLTLFFLIRWIKTEKFFPAGMMALLSMAVLIVISLPFKEFLKKKDV